MMIGFNPRFFDRDALRVIDDEQITIYLVNPKAPALSAMRRTATFT